MNTIPSDSTFEMDDRADFDNLAWDRNDEAWEQSQKFFRQISTLRKIEAFVTEKMGKRATWVSPLIVGGYNNLYRMRIEGSPHDVMIRLPQHHRCQFPDEKTMREAATAIFVAEKTAIPVPRVLFHGKSTPDSQIGPFIIIEHVENSGSMSHALAMPNKTDPTESHMLNPDISEHVLETSYCGAAVHVLQLFQPKFGRIGSLVQANQDFAVAGRPITQNMNNMLQLANIPRAALPPEDRTYATADEWYVALADMHLVQLVFQHNDLVSTADECRNMYVARQLFRKLAMRGRLSTFGFAEDNWSARSKARGPPLPPAPSRSEAFRLWCDDLRPGNMLLNDAGDVVAPIDWEFTYAAPTQFALDPPWWLLLNVPEMWHTNIEDWASVYEARLSTWLRAMAKAEDSAVAGARGIGGVRLSTYMRESWETGRFWLNYAARKSWAFDAIFWKYLDEPLFGSREGGTPVPREGLWKTRLHLLSEGERNAMEPFVERKMRESKERVLVDWNDEQVKERMAEVLFEDE